MMYQARTWLSRSFSTLSSNPLRVCVVGSGPAGFYTAEKMLKAHQEAEVDIIDRLPTPFGLVRNGVAPDHPETKNVMNQFSKVMQHERCSFLGNITLGSSISLPELRELYHVVILAYGAESDRKLGIPGEDLKGIHSARDFVWWYNGHPDSRELNPDVENTDTAVILGHGNVALDVARILLKPPRELVNTDISLQALTDLEQSSVRKVYIVGRRGPLQAAFTTKELREVLGITNLYVRVRDIQLRISPEEEEELKKNRMKSKIYELLKEAAAKSKRFYPSPGGRELHFAFCHKPISFMESDTDSGHVSGIRLEQTVVKDDGTGKQVAVGIGKYEEYECQMVIKSIGYEAVPVEGVPFDHQKGIVPNVRGRVLTEASGDETSLEKGLYVSGWLKRGPTGIIATTLYCAEETVASISEDIKEGKLGETINFPKPGKEGLLELLDEKNVKVIPYKGWENIDEVEQKLGTLRNKHREKLTSWDHLLKFGSMDLS